VDQLADPRLFENKRRRRGDPRRREGGVDPHARPRGPTLDPTVKLRLWSLARNDFAALERVSHTFGYGLTDDVIEECLTDLQAVKKEIIRRMQGQSSSMSFHGGWSPAGSRIPRIA
jgi:hypothetical protein